jgi:membrane-associated PAP2 superfamily phosphatase
MSAFRHLADMHGSDRGVVVPPWGYGTQRQEIGQWSRLRATRPNRQSAAPLRARWQSGRASSEVVLFALFLVAASVRPRPGLSHH